LRIIDIIDGDWINQKPHSSTFYLLLEKAAQKFEKIAFPAFQAMTLNWSLSR